MPRKMCELAVAALVLSAECVAVGQTGRTPLQYAQSRNDDEMKHAQMVALLRRQ